MDLKLRDDNFERSGPRLMIKMLFLINGTTEPGILIREAGSIFREAGGCEAISIRYQANGSDPSLISSGFSEKFLGHDYAADLICNSFNTAGNTMQTCFCLNVLDGKKIPGGSYTEFGSFWTNSLKSLISSDYSVRDKELFRCFEEGYESMAVIPLKFGEEIKGIVHFCDKQQLKFNLDKVHFIEGLATCLGGALSNIASRQMLRENELKQKAIADQLNRIKEELETAQQIAKIGSWEFITKDKKFFCAKEFRRILEIDQVKEILIKEDLIPMVLPADLNLFLSRVKKAIQNKSQFAEEFRVIMSDGRIKWIVLTGDIVTNADTQIEKVRGIIQDITERKNSESALNHSHDLMRYVIEHSGGAVAVFDRNLNYIYISERYIKDFGLCDGNIIGMNHYEVFPNLPKRLKQAHKEALNGIVVRKEDDLYEVQEGRYEWMRWECRPWYEADGSIGGIIIYTESITERKKIEDALRHSENQLNFIFNNAPVIMILVNEKVEILKMNKFGLEATGVHSQKVTGLKVGDVLNCLNAIKDPKGCGFSENCPGCRLRNSVETSLVTGKEFYKVEAQIPALPQKGDHVRTFLVSTSFIADAPEKQVLITIDDITSRKEIEIELIKAKNTAEESDKLKSAFLANISHEIRTPMNAIMGFSELLLNPDLTIDKRKQFTTLISNGCRQLLHIITDVIDISLIDTGQVRIAISTFNINELLEDLYFIFKSTAEIKNISFYQKKSLIDADAVISTDREKLKHIFSNLLTNSFKFTQEGYVEYGYNIDGGNIEFFVKDSGIGINPELHKAIFDRFRQAETTETRNYSGSGLGLSISKGYVEVLGGKIWLESEPGDGTVFIFTLPFEIKPEHRSISVEHESGRIGREIILIAEDDEINYFLLKELVTKLNCYPLHAKNGVEAIHEFKSNPAIRLVLMDLKMPVMDGYEAVRIIKELSPDIPVIALSSYFSNDKGDEILKYGFNGSILKPVDRSVLEKVIQDNLKGRFLDSQK
ncbi:MAG TPA: ATP-binding protein [Bacteroidales bacterium]|nr:ATP-binding protein [Bacteroidales bacterium]